MPIERTAEQERAAIVAWLRAMSRDPIAIFSLRERIFYAWWGFRNPSVSMVAARIVTADAIERGDHIEHSGYAETNNG